MKTSSSQWEFGELFPAKETRRILSVSELTGQVRRMLEQHVGAVWVTGEVTNLRSQSSGHIYFTLKDANAQVSCVLFRGEKIAHRDLMKDGQKLLLQGDITVYEARGQYQLIVRQVELQGVGALQLAFEKLKQKLQADGLFAPEHKRALPEFSERIGLVTSPTGAAIRDVLHVIRRRQPGLEIILAPCRVQGEGAAQEIAGAIGLLNEWHTQNPARVLDLILVTRGGGSLEDLWAFNEEVVARAIYGSAVPIVSAVGHEIDFTISDFVADVRAATPSAGAEIITEGMYASREVAAQAAIRLRQRTGRRLRDLAEELEGTRQQLLRMHPRRQWNERVQRLDDLREAFGRNVRHGVRYWRQSWTHQAGRFFRVRPGTVVRRRAELLEQSAQRLRELPGQHLREWRQSLELLESRLRLLGPDAVLARGYSITTVADTGKVVRDAAEVRTGQVLKTRLRVGEVASRVEGARSKVKN